jgi:acyl-CoA synthetase (NDP forming)
MQLERLLGPKSIAIYGASENPGPGRRILEMLDKLEYGGAVYPINPRYDTVLGKHCYSGIEDVPEGIDAIIFCVNRQLVMEPFQQAAARGYGGAVILDGGFAEQGEEGRNRQEELVAVSRDSGMAVCGPNCMGILSPHHRVSLYTSNLQSPEKLPGNVAVITQSGSIAIGLLTDCRRFGFSHVISAGNEAVTTTADYIDYLADDPNTRVIATFTEAVHHPERYVAALDKAADRGKPVVVLKVGRSERTRHAISGHTGGLAGESRVFSEVLKRHRAIEVSDMDELTEVLACCQGERLPSGRNIGVITGSGGQAELILDVAGASGLSLPPLSEAGRAEAGRVIGSITGDGNPLDAWGTGKYDVNMPHGLKVLADEPGIDSIVMVSDTRDDSPMVPTQYTPYLTAVARTTSKPCYFMNTRPGLFRQEFADALRSSGIATIGGTRQGLGAIDRLARWSAPVAGARLEQQTTGRIAGLLAESPTVRASLNEIDAKSLLGQAGLPVVRERIFAGPQDAKDAAEAIGYPLVLKVVSDDIPHKSDLGLVAIGLADEVALMDAVGKMSRTVDAMSPKPADAVFVVQEMISDGVELFMGVSVDPDFGPMLAFGLGGILVEVFDEVALRPLPLRAGDAEAMIAETRAARLLGPVRGRPPRDRDAVCRCLYALGDFAWAERESLDEIDLNPVLALAEGSGCWVVDALIIPQKETT